MTHVFDVPGINCADCARKITRGLEHLPGIDSVRVAIASRRVIVDGDLSAGELVEAIGRCGFEANPSSLDSIRERIEKRRERRAGESKFWKRHCIIAGATLAAVTAMMVAHGRVSGGMQFVVATAALVALAPPFYRKGLPDLLHLRFGMDSLVALGTILAYGVSSIELISGGHTFYFEDSVAILAFLTIGRYLEARGKDRAMGAVENLVDLAPPFARIVREGNEVEVPTGEVVPGDEVIVRPGEKVTVDGVVLEGSADADESLLTGESMPVTKEPGSRVIAGSLLHLGALRIRADRTGEETSLGEILRELEKIDERRTRYHDLADRVIGYFMPTVLGIALVTFAAWWFLGHGIQAALRPAIAVLIIACPCALGIAIPIAVSVGAGVAARRGVLIRDPSALDRIPGLATFIFDKTGSITMGKLRVADVLAVGISEAEGQRIASSAEKRSEHPLARAIVAAAPEAADPAAFKAEPGLGVEAEVGGEMVRVGRLSWCGIDPDVSEQDWISRAADEGRSVFGARIGSRARLFFAVEDAMRPEAREVVAELKSRGLRVMLVSGDNRAIVEAIAARAGIDECRAEVLPLEKSKIVREVRDEGGAVAMLGDGVNDAAAISEADLGIAMKSGAGLSAEAADAVLMRDDLREVLELLGIGSAIRGMARQNLFWAFFYNVILIPAAALGFATPMMAAVAMALSDVTVILNSLRLWKFAPATKL